MSEQSNETAVNAASAFMNADVFYEESVPEEPTEAGESPEVEEEAVAESEAETEAVDTQDDDDSKRYDFNEESGEYTFRAAGKDYTANTDKLIELASKGVGFEKKNAQTKRNEQQRSREHAEALELVKARESELQTLIESLDGFLGEEQINEELLDDNPSEYIRQEKRQRERKAKLDDARQQLVQRRQEQSKALASKEFSKLREVMEWDTQEKVTQGFNEISDYCLSIGLSGDDMKDLFNHRMYRALSDAAKYRALQSKKDNVVKEVKSAPKSVKSKKSAPAKQEKSAAEVLYGT